MMFVERCPLCGAAYESKYSKCVRLNELDQSLFVRYFCRDYNATFYLHESIEAVKHSETQDRMFDLIVERLIHSQKCVVDGEERHWHFYLSSTNKGMEYKEPEYVDLFKELKTYPDQFMDKAHRALMNLSLRYPHYGDRIILLLLKSRIVFEHEPVRSATPGIMQILEDVGYVKNVDSDDAYAITASGWQKIEELRKNEQVVRQAFIAMIFREEARSIREAFRQGIEEMGYHAVILDEKEHNNQIVPEIFYEIKRSKFVVVDVTYPSFGAYYEAGYAQALGKEVIVCCRETEFDSAESSPHFDIAQKAIIKWKDEAELVERLKRRIEATVT